MREKLDDATAKLLHGKLKTSATRLGFGYEAEEIAQAVRLRMLEGRHQHATCDQAVIDYLRAEYGRKGEPGYDLKQALTLKRQSWEEYIIQHPGQFRTELGHGSIAFDLLKHIRGQDRAMFLLTHYWGFNEIEIGNLFGISPSRVCQRLQRVPKCVQSGIKAEKSAYRKREMEKILHPKASYYARDMELRTYQGVAIGESWQMASFDAEGF